MLKRGMRTGSREGSGPFFSSAILFVSTVLITFSYTDVFKSQPCKEEWGKRAEKQKSPLDSDVTQALISEWTLFVCLFFGCALGLHIFLDKGSHPCHSSNPSPCRDNARSLTYCATGERLGIVFKL